MNHARVVPDLPPRKSDAHKGDFGRVLVVAGSTGMVGAAALAGDAALRAGAGLVTVATSRSAYPVLAAKLTCCTTCPLPETPSGAIAASAAGPLMKLCADFDAVAIGPGLGAHSATARLARMLVAGVRKPMVIDADGLNALAENPHPLKSAAAPRILTPHPGEMARLAGLSVGEVQRTREKVAAWVAREHRCVVVLKGHRTVVSDGQRVFINDTGNPGMATGGAGDVLTGVIAALLAQGLSPFDAAVLGVHIHGLAGDLAAREVGQVSLIATDILSFLPQAFITLGAKKRRRRS